MTIKMYQGKMQDWLAKFPANKVDAVVTDPPYGLKFMDHEWDYDVPSIDQFRAIYRVMKPGAHILCAGGTRTYHRLVCNLEDAGFEVRDMISWVYGSGFPKSHNVIKAIDKALGAERPVIGVSKRHGGGNKPLEGQGATGFRTNGKPLLTGPATPEAEQWDGWGTALKPAVEPFCLARKPLSEKTVADNVMKWGTGAINIEASRVGKKGESKLSGRFPANLIHDGSEEVVGLFPDKAGALVGLNGNEPSSKTKNVYQGGYQNTPFERHDDLGSAARFFYCAKASPNERGKYNDHPTVKPIELMKYLVQLITPPGGLVLDPYMGSGTTGLACIDLGVRFAGIELSAKNVKIAKRRVNEFKNSKKSS